METSKEVSDKVTALLEKNKQSEEEISKLRKENEDLKTENDRTKAEVKIMQSELTYQSQNKEQYSEDITLEKYNSLAREINNHKIKIQNLNEELAEKKELIKELEDQIFDIQKKNVEKINSLNKLIDYKNDEISQLKEQIATLKNEQSSNKKENNNEIERDKKKNDSDNLKSKQNKSIVSKNQNDISTETFVKKDLPSIDSNASIVTRRSIKSVIDVDNGEEISSEIFFKKPKEEIARIGRRLEIISRTDSQPLYVCAMCEEPVKISKITSLQGESPFFIHCRHDVDCRWKHEKETQYEPVYDVEEDFIEVNSSEFIRYQYIKRLIHNILCKQIINDKSISQVEIDYKIRSKNNLRKWRKFDVFTCWNGKNIVFKLQRSKDYLQNLVSYDEFAKENDLYIILRRKTK